MKQVATDYVLALVILLATASIVFSAVVAFDAVQVNTYTSNTPSEEWNIHERGSATNQ